MSYESGIRALRLEFVRESTYNTPPTDPAWGLYSDAVQSFSVSPQASVSPRGNIGTPDVVNFNSGTESHEFSVTYDLQRFFVDGGGDPVDPAGDGMIRLSDGQLPNSHTVVARARSGDDGIQSGGSYIYYVATGAKINSVNLGGEPESGDPIVVTLDYMCRKLRAYQIDQPSASGTVDVVSTSTADTSQTLTIESEDAGVSEDVALTGSTPVTTTASFPTIDAAWLDGECVGDVTIEKGSDTLMIIYGSASYDDREGDLGVPALGSGSHGSEIGTAYENILGDTITRGGVALGIDADISSVSISVENGIETSSTIYSIGKALSEGMRTINLNASVFGPTASYDAMIDHLRTVESDIVWTLSGGTCTLVGAAMTSLGSIARDTGMAVLSVDNTFQGKSLTLAAS